MDSSNLVDKIKEMYPWITDSDIEKILKNEELIKMLLDDPFKDDYLEKDTSLNFDDNFAWEEESFLDIKKKINQAKNLLNKLKIIESDEWFSKEYRVYNLEWDYIWYAFLKISGDHMEISDLWTSNLNWGFEDVNGRLKQEILKMEEFKEKWLGTAILLYIFTKVASKYWIKTFNIISAKHADEFYKKTLNRLEEVGLVSLFNEWRESFFSWEILQEVEL